MSKKGHKWTEAQKQAARDRWTPEMKEEAKFRALVYHHRDLLIRLMETPERIEMLKKLATPL